MNETNEPETPKKETLTTVEVAKLLNVAPRTVCKWFDAGRLDGYRLPNGNRMIPVECLDAFCRKYHMSYEGMAKEKSSDAR